MSQGVLYICKSQELLLLAYLNAADSGLGPVRELIVCRVWARVMSGTEKVRALSQSRLQHRCLCESSQQCYVVGLLKTLRDQTSRFAPRHT